LLLLTINSQLGALGSFSLNKKTNVITYVWSYIDSLYDFILPFFNSLPFRSRKEVDLLWSIAVRMHKGYYALPEGKSLLLSIASSINTFRYSTNPGGPAISPTLDFISSSGGTRFIYIYIKRLLFLGLENVRLLASFLPPYIYFLKLLLLGLPAHYIKYQACCSFATAGGGGKHGPRALVPEGLFLPPRREELGVFNLAGPQLLLMLSRV